MTSNSVSRSGHLKKEFEKKTSFIVIFSLVFDFNICGNSRCRWHLTSIFRKCNLHCWWNEFYINYYSLCDYYVCQLSTKSIVRYEPRNKSSSARVPDEIFCWKLAYVKWISIYVLSFFCVKRIISNWITLWILFCNKSLRFWLYKFLYLLPKKH